MTAAVGQAASRRWRIVLVAVCVALLLLFAYAGIVARLAMRQKQLWFRPAPASVGEWNPTDVAVQEVRFPSADGTELVGWYVPHPKPRAIILVLHGSSGNIATEVGVLTSLHRIVEATTLIVDYRGYGKSAGSVGSEADFIADATAARDYLARRTNRPTAEIVLIGRSMGGALAVALATKEPPRALILQNSLPSLADIVRHHYWWAPISPFLQDSFAAIDHIAAYHGPLLLSHAAHDEVIPLPMARRLFEKANSPKKFLVLQGDHATPEDASYYQALREFLDEHPIKAKR